MPDFEASVQYDDFRGTVAADRSDTESMTSYLISQGLANKDERVVGYRISFSGNHGHELDPGVLVYLRRDDDDPSNKIFRAIDVPMAGPKFFSFFKRFSLVLMESRLDLSNVTVDGPRYG